MQKIIKPIKDALNGQQGAVLPLIGLAFGIMVLASGFAIDYARAQIVRERLQWAVDAGALAGAKVAAGGSIKNIRSEAQAYFRANFPVGYMNTQGGTINAQRINSATGKGQGLRFTVTNLSMQNYFFKMFGHDSMQITALAEVNTLPVKPLDVVFSVDLSGSMQVVAGKGASCIYLDESTGQYPPGCYSGTSKLSNAKTAMNKMVEQLYGGEDTRFGVVGWSAIVNIYGSMTSKLSSVACDGGNRLSALAWDVAAPGRIGWGNAKHPQPDYPMYDECMEFSPGTIKGGGSKRPIQYLTDVKSEIDGAITKLKADGNTDGSLGMHWAYNMFHDVGWAKWRNPAANRSIVLLTDGDNTKYFKKHGHPANPELYGPLADAEQLGVCTKAKNEGITVYTIAYDLDNSSANRVRGKKMLSDCASRSCPTNTGGICYFDARSPAALYKAIETIGNTMMTMRLTR